MKAIILAGLPGCGKGTQAKILSEKLGYKIIATGEILRDNIRRGTMLGKRAAKAAETGELAPDDVISRMIEFAIEDAIADDANCKGFILDGAVRTPDQYKYTERMFKLFEIESEYVEVIVSDDVAKARIAERYKEAGRTDDSNETAINNRIELYKENAEEIALYLALNKKTPRAVIGSQPIEAVTKNILYVVSPLIKDDEYTAKRKAITKKMHDQRNALTVDFMKALSDKLDLDLNENYVANFGDRLVTIGVADKDSKISTNIKFNSEIELWYRFAEPLLNQKNTPIDVNIASTSLSSEKPSQLLKVMLLGKIATNITEVNDVVKYFGERYCNIRNTISCEIDTLDQKRNSN